MHEKIHEKRELRLKFHDSGVYYQIINSGEVMETASNTVECTIKNKLGLHARPASLFVQTASKFDCEITVQKEEETANGKSLMSLLVLSAPFGSKLRISAVGPDAEEAVKALLELINRRFDEE